MGYAVPAWPVFVPSRSTLQVVRHWPSSAASEPPDSVVVNEEVVMNNAERSYAFDHLEGFSAVESNSSNVGDTLTVLMKRASFDGLARRNPSNSRSSADSGACGSDCSTSSARV